MPRTVQKPSLKQAVTLVETGMDIAWWYARHKNYQPTKFDIKMMDHLLEMLWQHHCTLETVIKQLRQRK